MGDVCVSTGPLMVLFNDGRLTDDATELNRNLILYSGTKGSGVGIPYPAISLHAIQRLRVPGEAGASERQGLYMQIETGDDGGYEEEGAWEVTVVPSSAQGQSRPSVPATLEPNVEPATGSIRDAAVSPPSNPITPDERPLIEQLFAAVSACSNLHPDPVDGGDHPDSDNPDDENEDPILFEGGVGYESVLPGVTDGLGGLPPPFPGSGGWITAENVGDFFNEDGSWRGRTRGREEGPEEVGEEEEGSKWRRTE